MKLNVIFSESKQDFSVGFVSNNREFTADFESFQTVTDVPDADYYEGEYDIIPKTTEQVLQTRQKIMTDDLSVKSIPYYDTSNPAGGQTVYIGQSLSE